MTDKELDNLFAKQEIKLSASFNESLFAEIENEGKDLNELFSEQKLSLNSSFNTKVLDDARIDSFFREESLKLGSAFCDEVFAKISEKKETLEMPKRNLWSLSLKISSIAAAFVAGIFLANSYFTNSELIPENSEIFQIAKENIKTEIDYFLLEDDMNTLSQEIDSLEASIIELESYKYTTASLD